MTAFTCIRALIGLFIHLVVEYYSLSPLPQASFLWIREKPILSLLSAKGSFDQQQVHLYRRFFSIPLTHQWEKEEKIAHVVLLITLSPERDSSGNDVLRALIMD